MKKLLLVLGSVLALSAGAANAETVVTDTDGNGMYSMEELKAAYPDLTDDVFTSVDVDANGSIDADELQAAREAGTLAA
jgi:EF hand